MFQVRSADALCTAAGCAGLGAALLAFCTDLQRTQQDRVSFHSHHHSSSDSQHVSLGAMKQISDYTAAKQRLQQASAFHKIQSKRSGANKLIIQLSFLLLVLAIRNVRESLISD